MKKPKRTGLPAEGMTVMLLLLALLCIPMAPSSGPVDEVAAMIGDQSAQVDAVQPPDEAGDETWDEETEEEPLSDLKVVQLASPADDPGADVLPAATAIPAREATPAPQASPTPAPQATVYVPLRLSMSDFSGGSAVRRERYDSATKTYQDDSITVTGYREKRGGTLYYVADVTVADPSQLRTALGGTPTSAARVGIERMAKRVNAVVAVNGDFYPNRGGGYIVRQGNVLAKSLSNDLDLLAVDYAGDFHCISAKDKKTAIKELEGNIYQCFSFGPVLIRDGELVDLPREYSFGIHYRNPRTGIGQIGPLHYLLVVASGRNDASKSITCSTLASFMYSKGCVQAFNLDGGASSVMYFKNGIFSRLTDGGERSLFDIVYFASTADTSGGGAPQ